MNHRLLSNMINSKDINTVLFWGSIWGLAEASLGWALHAVHIPHVWIWMVPVAIACMTIASFSTGRASSAAIVAMVAAAVKLVDLLLPTGQPAWYILHPAGYIALEGLPVAAIIGVASHRHMPRVRLAITHPVALVTLVISIAVNVLI